ncbi:MAG: hypothetical protein WEB00_03675 [Dehalococcoidia bacterium]
MTNETDPKENPKEEDLRAGGNRDEEPHSPLLQEAIDKGESFQKDAPGGGTHEKEVGKPAWGDKQGDMAGQEGKQQQSGGGAPDS